MRLESKFCYRNEVVSAISSSSKNVLVLWFNGSKAASFCVSDQVINRRTLQMSLNSVLYLCRNPCYHPSPSAVFPVFPAITQLPMFPEFPEFLEFPTFTLPFVSQLFQWFQCSLSSLSSLLSPFPLCPSGSSGSCYHSQCSTACSFLCQFEIFRT